MHLERDSLPSVGSGVNWQLLILLGGLTLAVGSAIGLGLFGGRKTHAPTGGTTPSHASATAPELTRSYVGRPTETQESTIYIVESEAAKREFQHEVFAAHATEGINGVTPVILVIASPELKSLFHSRPSNEKGPPTFHVVDLR